MRSNRGLGRSLVSSFTVPALMLTFVGGLVVTGATGACAPTGEGTPEPAPAEPEPTPTPALDAGSPETDGGEPSTPAPDAGTPEPGVDAGPAVPPPDGGPTDAGPVDGGPVGACEPVDPCAGIAVTNAVTLNTGATAGFTVGASTFNIGTATRAEIDIALGTGVANATNIFRAYQCAHGLDLRYVDDVQNNDEFESASSANDVLSRVLTLSTSTATTSGGISVGATRTAAMAAMTTPVAHTLQGFTFDFDAAQGWSTRSTAGTVDSISLFKPQTTDHWGATVNYAAASITSNGTTIDLDSEMDDVEALLGTAFDVEGEVPDQAVTVVARVYGAFGVRVGDAQCVFNQCDGIQSYILSAPFLGQDTNGLGLGSTQTEIEAVLGAVTSLSGDGEDDDKVHVYSANNDVGVLYVKDADCTKRAAAFILNFFEP